VALVRPVKYRTIVADPPWALEWNANVGIGRSGRSGLPYPTMTVEEICQLPVAAAAERDAHLWLWTTATFLWDAPRVALSWGFRPTYTLVWTKAGLGVGGRFRHTVEYCLFCERGAQLPVTRRDLPTHFAWPRGRHSAKPEHFIDLVESVSPSPYLEMFSRRHRIGWDVWGDESANTSTLDGEAS
jgi:N6-adenosine-specific RNA methylase IME4